MNFDTTEFLLLAWELVGQPKERASQEALLRTAISRAYYAAFHAARNHLQNVDGVCVTRLDAHQFVINEYFYNGDERRRDIGVLLQAMRYRRNRADYESRYPRLAKAAIKTVNDAEDVIAAVGWL